MRISVDVFVLIALSDQKVFSLSMNNLVFKSMVFASCEVGLQVQEKN